MTCFCFTFKNKASSSNQPVDEEVMGVQNTRLYSYKELVVATENFSTANKIGEGGFGPVYKGRLRDGSMVAVKILSAYSRQGVREFLTEIQVIAEIEHDNLVKLYGCCVEDKHRILVYGYLENNSIARALLGRGHSSIQFSWNVRRNICIGVAKGLAFLHEEVQPHIIHRDIKASNILLDKHLTPKISDFGLAKLFPPNLTHVTTRVAGTEGYLAPEYAIRGQVTRKADVYSYGVLLLEIVSGRPNTNRRLLADDQYLLETAWKLYEREELLEVVDTSLNGDFDDEEACRYLKVALLCTQDMPKLRPSMSMVVRMLTGDIDVNKMNISKPGLLAELMGHNYDKGNKNNLDQKNMSLATSADSGELHDSSSSSKNMSTSHATMTFSSIYDRSN